MRTEAHEKRETKPVLERNISGGGRGDNSDQRANAGDLRKAKWEIIEITFETGKKAFQTYFGYSRCEK